LPRGWRASKPGTVTDLLKAWRHGDEQAHARLVSVVYKDLRLRAARLLRRERPSHTLRTGDLVHEAYLRLVDQRVEWQSRSQFFAIASQVMRRVLVDYARRRLADKRAGIHVALAEDHAVGRPRDVELLTLDRALDELAVLEPRHARLVELRYFGEFSIEAAAEALDISPATAKRDWTLARAWLLRRIRSG